MNAGLFEGDAADARRGVRWDLVFAVLLVTVAAAVRVPWMDVTLFEDEVWVAELARDGGLRPHSFNAPPLFYILERAAAAAGGASARTLRWLPLLFGVALPVLALLSSRFVRQITPGVAALWALMLAFSSPLIFYSVKVKQYTLEATVVTILLILALRVFERPERRTIVALCAVATAASLTLHSPVIAFGGIVAAGAVTCMFDRAARERLRPFMLLLAAGSGIVAAAFAAAWIGYMAPGEETTRLHGDMTDWFARTGRWMSGSPSQAFGATTHWVGQALNLTRAWALVVVVAAVAVAFRPAARRRLNFLALAAAFPPAATFAASMVKVYPYSEVRLMIFCFPAAMLLLSAAMVEVFQFRRGLLTLLVGFWVAAFCFRGIARDPYNATYMSVSDLTPILDSLARNHDGAPIYCDAGLCPVIRFHRPALAPYLREGTSAAANAPAWVVARSVLPSGTVYVSIPGAALIRTEEEPPTVAPDPPAGARGEPESARTDRSPSVASTSRRQARPAP